MRKILIIEDEVYARQSMKKQILECLKEEKWCILEASNGQQGLELVKREIPELIFTDIRMPVMDGLEFLKSIKAAGIQAKVVMVSAYADFEYAKTAMKFGAEEYLLKPIEEQELRECLGKFEKLKKQENSRDFSIAGEDGLTRFISRNLFSDIPQRDFINENMFRKIFSIYQILVLYFPKEKEPGLERLYQMLQENGEEIFTGFRIIQVQTGLYAVLMYADGLTTFRQKKLLRRLVTEGESVWGGVSPAYTESRRIKSAYQQALEALECKVFQQEKLLYYQDTIQRYTQTYRIDEVQQDLLIMGLEKGNLDIVRASLKQMFREMKAKSSMNSKSLELFLTQMTVLFHQAAEKKDGLQSERGFYKFQLLDFASLTEIESVMEEKAEMICRGTKKESLGKGEELIQVMKEYARENCSRDITVKTLAEKVFFMNPAYLSHLFKEKTGESYSSYLKHIRMEKAKTLLEEEGCSITDVGAMTGYNDTSQFIRIFKQEMGITPKKYRDEIIKRKRRKE